MMTYKYDTMNDLISFITNTPDFLEWETMSCKLYIQNGLNMNIDTKIVSPQGISNIQFKYIKSTIDNFRSSLSGNNSINLEIKFKVPEILQNYFDPGGEYNAFYVTNYGDGTLMMSQTSHYEKSRNSGLAPLAKWDEYFANLYTNWYNTYKLYQNTNGNNVLQQ